MAFFSRLISKEKQWCSTLKTTPVEELRHYAQDARKSKEEIALITEPKEEISLTAKGILVVGND